MDRRRRTGSVSATSDPLMSTRPEVGSVIRLTRLSRVDLPEPLDPTSTTVELSSTVKETLSTATDTPEPSG